VYPAAYIIPEEAPKISRIKKTTQKLMGLGSKQAKGVTSISTVAPIRPGSIA